MRNAVLTHRPDSLEPVKERVARTARECRVSGAILAGEPGRKFTPEDVAADLAAHGSARQRSIDGWLREEARAASGRVVRLATRVYVARSGPGDGSIDPAQRVLVAARSVRPAPPAGLSVQELLALVNADGAELSQRSVYYGVRHLLDGGRLVRVRWGHYAIASPEVDGLVDGSAGEVC